MNRNLTGPVGRYSVVTRPVDTDWYPASYPWHSVLELPPAGERRVDMTLVVSEYQLES